LHGDSKGQGKETNVEANNNSGGRAARPVRHKIPLGILIFLVSAKEERKKSKKKNKVKIKKTKKLLQSYTPSLDSQSVKSAIIS